MKKKLSDFIFQYGPFILGLILFIILVYDTSTYDKDLLTKIILDILWFISCLLLSFTIKADLIINEYYKKSKNKKI